MSEFHLDSIVETIKKLDGALNCPFCKANPSSFQMVFLGLFQPWLCCSPWKVSLSLHPRHPTYKLGWLYAALNLRKRKGLDRLSDYETKEIQEGGKIDK